MCRRGRPRCHRAVESLPGWEGELGAELKNGGRERAYGQEVVDVD